MSPRARTAARAAAAILAAVAVSVPAPGGVPLVDGEGTAYRWDLDAPGQPNVFGGAVTYYVDPRGTVDTIRGPKSPGDAIRDAVKAWEAPGTTRIRFREDATRSASGRNGTDRVNWIGWTSSGLSPFTFAATFPTRNGSQIVDMDVVLNDRDFAWDTRTPGVPGVADIQALVTHEWGHAIGADHVPLRLSTMYFSADAGTTSLRTLADDDVALVGASYPSATFAATTATLRGRVTVTGVKDSRAVHVVAVSVSTAEPAASTLTEPDGSFVLRGLPRGAYRVLATPTLPLGDAMNAYWRTGTTAFLPAVAAEDTGNPARVRTVLLAEAGETEVEPFTVGPATSPFEPNDALAQATPIRLGDAVCARFESSTDQDWYAFDAVAGARVTLSVLAWELGSSVDPSLRLTDATGAVVPGGTVFDIRNGAFSTQVQGVDRDARIVGWTVPSTGRYGVRVASENSVSGTNAWYVLLVTVASDSPSSILTTASATPDRIDADGASSTTLVIRPRREDGADVGAGANVQVVHSGVGAVGPVTYEASDASYRAVVTAPPAPGRDVFSVVVSSAAGLAAAQDAATLVYVGPAVAARTTLRAEPRRIAADGAEETTIRFVPRDAAGEALGAGRAVSFEIAPDLGASLEPGIDDAPDGTYLGTLVSGTAPGRATVTASVGGQTDVAAATVAFGFDLADVLDMASADVAAFRAVPGLPRKAALAAGTAEKRVAAAEAAAAEAPGSQKARTRALVKAKTALGAVATALRKAAPRIADPGTPREIALAVRQAAREARTAAEIRTVRDQKRADEADRLLGLGDEALASGNAVAAGNRWLQAYRAVLPLL